MTYEKLWVGAVLMAGLVGACSSKGDSSGTAGSGGGTAGSAGAAGSSGTAGAGTAGGGTAGGGTAGAGTAGAGGALVPPTVLMSDIGCGPARLVVSGGTLYWTSSMLGTVNSISTGGGTRKVIAMAQNLPNALAVDGTSIYWGNDGDRTVMKQPLASGTAAVLVPAPTDTDPKNVVNALLIDKTTLYIGRGLDTYKVPTTGGTLVQLSHSPAADVGYPSAFALDATHLFQTESGHSAISREVL